MKITRNVLVECKNQDVTETLLYAEFKDAKKEMDKRLKNQLDTNDKRDDQIIFKNFSQGSYGKNKDHAYFRLNGDEISWRIQTVEIELLDSERYSAYEEQQWDLDVSYIRNNLDSKTLKLPNIEEIITDIVSRMQKMRDDYGTEEEYAKDEAIKEILGEEQEAV
jgi:hypothetical protein